MIGIRQIPGGMLHIDKFVFKGDNGHFTGEVTIIVDSNRPALKSVDGSLISKPIYSRFNNRMMQQVSKTGGKMGKFASGGCAPAFCSVGKQKCSKDKYEYQPGNLHTSINFRCSNLLQYSGKVTTANHI